MNENNITQERPCQGKNRKGKKHLIWFLSIFGIILIAALAIGGMKHHFDSFEKVANHVEKRITNELELNKEQQSKLHDIKLNIIAKKKEFQGFHKDIYEEILTESKKNNFDKGKVNKLLETQEEKFREMRKFFVDQYAEFHNILSTEQREKLVQNMMKHKERMRKYHSGN